jgi:hypothetical protein
MVRVLAVLYVIRLSVCIGCVPKTQSVECIQSLLCDTVDYFSP